MARYAILIIVLTLIALTNVASHLSQGRSPIKVSIPQSASQGSSNTQGLLYVSPSSFTNLPAGSKFSLGIQAFNLSYFFGWDVYVETDPSVIVPESVNFTVPPDLFLQNYTVTPSTISECINGTLIRGGACGTPSGSGIAHLAAVVFPPPNSTTIVPPVNGLLFNITYKVVASVGFSTIQILQNATLTNGTAQPVLPALLDGSYGAPVPYVSLSSNPVSPAIPEGAESSTRITLTSHYHFAGPVNLTISVPSLSLAGAIGGHLESTTLTLDPDGSNSTDLLLNATNVLASSIYPLTITSSSSSPVSVPLTLLVNVEQLSFFEAQISPGLLRIHAGQSAETTVELQSEVGFSGRVNLALQAPVSLGVTATLAAQSVDLQSGSTLSTMINVTTPSTSLPFIYRINLTVTGMGSAGPLYVIQTLTVLPPAASLSVAFTPSVVEVRAGESSSVTITASSVDYFWGFLYASAIMSGGAVEFNSSIYYIALPSSPHASYTPSQVIGVTISVDASTPPGNYIALITVYSLATGYQRAFSTQISIPVKIDPPVLHAADKVFGLRALEYFGILGALAIPLVVLSVLTYLRREKDDEDWRA